MIAEALDFSKMYAWEMWWLCRECDLPEHEPNALQFEADKLEEIQRLTYRRK